MVKDSLSGEPIPYVNIWVENETIGTTSETDGSFLVPTTKEKNIIFSVLGYEKKTIKGLQSTTVFLTPIAYELNEIILLNKKQTKKTEIGIIKNAIFQSFDNGPKVEAKYFPFLDSYKKTKFIKEVTLFTDSSIDSASVKIHFYRVDESGFPGTELLAKDFVVFLSKGVLKHKFDLSQFDLIFPEEGLFVAYEKLFIERNKTGTKFQPYVLYNFVERAFFYTFSYGKWHKQEANLHENLQLNEPAITLILSN